MPLQAKLLSTPPATSTLMDLNTLSICAPCSEEASIPILSRPTKRRLNRRRNHKGLKHVCFACAFKEEEVTARKARIANNTRLSYLSLTLLGVLCITSAVTAAAPPETNDGVSSILSFIFLSVRWLRFGSFYALCAIVPTLIFNTLLCPPRKVDHTKPPTT